MNLNELKNKAYRTACEHGFHSEEYSNDHYMMLVITELSKATEVIKRRYANLIDYYEYQLNCIYSSKGDTTQIFLKSYELFIKDSFEDTLAGAAIRLLDLAGLQNIDLSSIGTVSSIPFKERSIEEIMYAIVYHSMNDVEHAVKNILIALFDFANHLEIDLREHIKMKMMFNEIRGILHGKKY